MKEPTSIASFDRAEPAQVVAARLRETCFQAAVVDTSGEEFWSLCGLRPRGHFKVMVPLQQAERAMSWLREFDAADQLLATAVRCPQCGSTRVEYPQLSQRQPLFPAGSDVGEHDYHCERCNRVWPGDPEVASVGAAHLAA
jgi:hypothetical protein